MRTFTVKPKSVEAATTVRTYQNKRNPNKYIERHDDGYGHRSLKQYMQWDRDGETVKNPTGDGNLHRWRKKNTEELLEDYDELQDDVDADSDICGATDPYEGNNYDWMIGVYWSVDWHKFKVVEVDNQLSTCKVKESWIAEDTGKDCEHTSTFVILTDDRGYLYIQSKKYPSFKLYLNSAINYRDKVSADQDELAFLDKEIPTDPSPYDYEDDDYTPSSTRGDYSPSNPWDAPGMSIHDFI